MAILPPALPFTESSLKVAVMVALLTVLQGALSAVRVMLPILKPRDWLAWTKSHPSNGPWAAAVSEHEPGPIVMWQKGLPSNLTVLPALVPAIELVEVSVMVPGHEMTTDIPALVLHVVLAAALPERVSLPDEVVPVASILSVNSAVGQVMVKPLAMIVKSVDDHDSVDDIGVNTAWAGAAVTARALSMARVSRKPREGARRMSFSFWARAYGLSG